MNVDLRRTRFHDAHPPGQYVQDAELITRWLAAEFPDAGSWRMVDVGCNNGLFVRAWLDLIGREACGIDWHNMIPHLVIPQDRFFARDLRVALDHEDLLLGHKHDLALCLEVGEHVPESSAETLVETCVRLLDRERGRVVWSAAIPGQGGHKHINEQPHTYWHRAFARHGLYPRAIWRQAVDLSPWYSNNAFLYERPAWDGGIA